MFFALHPEQKKLYDLEGSYWYQWPQGERVPQVRDRVRFHITTLTRDFSGKKVWTISHYLERLTEEKVFNDPIVTEIKPLVVFLLGRRLSSGLLQ